MYGIVNKAIQGLITENYGESTWNEVNEKSGVNIDLFLSNEPYPDEITYKLAIAASEVLNINLESILIAFGEYWVLNTGMKNYGSLMKSGGDNLKEFIINLPNFHNRIQLMYPNLSPPEFKVTEITEKSLSLHYYSERLGLKFFVYGLLQGLGKMYNTPINIEITQSRDEGADHEVFMIKW